MIANMDIVKAVLDSKISAYEIEKETDISRMTITNYRNGKAKPEKMTVENAIKLTEFGKERKLDMLKFENLMATYVEEDGTYTLEFQGDKNYFLNNVEAPGAEKDEFYFDDKVTVDKIIAEASQDDIEEA